MFKIEQLKDFISVVKFEGYHQASKAIHKSQPAISLSIKKLEEQLEFDLFEKNLKKVVLTSSGKTFYKEALKLLKKDDSLNAVAKMLKAGYEPSIRVCLSPLVPLDAFSDGLHQFKENFPYTALMIGLDSYDIASIKVADDECDLAICPMYSNNMNLIYEAVGYGKMIPVTGHPEIAKVTTINQLQKFEQIILVGRQDNSAPNDIHMENGKKWQVYDNCTLFDLVRSGFGWGLLPEYRAKQAIERGMLHQVNVPTLTQTHKLYFSANEKNFHKEEFLFLLNLAKIILN